MIDYTKSTKRHNRQASPAVFLVLLFLGTISPRVAYADSLRATQADAETIDKDSSFRSACAMAALFLDKDLPLETLETLEKSEDRRIRTAAKKLHTLMQQRIEILSRLETAARQVDFEQISLQYVVSAEYPGVVSSDPINQSISILPVAIQTERAGQRRDGESC